MKLNDVQNVLVYGKGISGTAAAKVLNDLSKTVTLCDDSDYDGAIDYDMVVVSPAIPKTHAVFSRHYGKIISEIELGGMLCEKPIIAITGTNGKTTTVKLLGEMLNNSHSACVTGNVGRAFCLDALNADYDTYVCEVSSFQLENVANFRPHIAAITNIDCDHLDRHGDMLTYAREKLKITRRQTENDYLILPQYDLSSAYLTDLNTRANVLYTAMGKKVNGAWTDGEKLFWLDQPVCDVRRIKMRGEHNLKNALTALACAKLYGVGNEQIVRALTTFSPPNHRLKYIGSIKGITFYNDSKGTNIGATKAAIKAMEMPFALIVGGSDKGCEYDELFATPVENLRKVCACGDNAQKIIAAARRNGVYKTVLCDSLQKAVIEAYHGGVDSVLFSPASASFDRYTDYRQRGEAYENIFREIKKSEKY